MLLGLGIGVFRNHSSLSGSWRSWETAEDSQDQKIGCAEAIDRVVRHIVVLDDVGFHQLPKLLQGNAKHRRCFLRRVHLSRIVVVHCYSLPCDSTESNDSTQLG